MPRQLRVFSNSKVYHIILKGIDNQNIFYDDEDRIVFLENISKSKEKFKYKVYAYCLMDNHVHLVIQVDDKFLSKAMQSLTIRYVYYFNKKYDREGPLVRNRFKSKQIENQSYFLEVCRYIHRNPEKANIEKTQNYMWSSYLEYIEEEKIVSTKILMYYFNYNLTQFIKYTLKGEENEELSRLADFELINKLADEQLIKIIQTRFNLKCSQEIISFIKNSSEENKEQIIKEIGKIQGVSKKQISRVTRINKNKISKILQQ